MVNVVLKRRKINESVTHLFFEHAKKQITVLGRERAVQLVVRVHDSLHAPLSAFDVHQIENS